MANLVPPAFEMPPPLPSTTPAPAIGSSSSAAIFPPQQKPPPPPIPGLDAWDEPSATVVAREEFLVLIIMKF